jgi:hypothetical protein
MGRGIASYSTDTRVFFLGVKRLEREVDHSLPCSAERMCGAVPLLFLYAFIVWTETLPFTSIRLFGLYIYYKNLQKITGTWDVRLKCYQ